MTALIEEELELNGEQNPGSTEKLASYLIADIGSCTTTVQLFDEVEDSYRLAARGSALTTAGHPWFDVTRGVQQAVEQEWGEGEGLLAGILAGFGISITENADLRISRFFPARACIPRQGPAWRYVNRIDHAGTVTSLPELIPGVMPATMAGAAPLLHIDFMLGNQSFVTT